MQGVECESCGAVLRLKEEYVGRRIKCPKCGTAFVVPELEPEWDEEDPLFSIASQSATPPRESPAVTVPGQSLGNVEMATSTPSYLQPPAAPMASPAFAAKTQDLADQRAAKEQRSGAMRQIGLGAVIMSVAAIWFVGGLMAGWFFYYPPLLFIVGIITVIKGCFGYSE